MPDIIQQPDGDWVDADILYDTPNYDMVAASHRVDGAANSHIAELWQNGNCAVVYYRKLSPAGVLMAKKNIVTRGTPHELRPDLTNTQKTVDFDMAPSGTDMVFQLGGHNVPGHTHNVVSIAKVVGVYVPYQQGASPEHGAAGSFVPDPNSGGGEVEIDYARIEAIVNFVVTRVVGADQADSLVHKIVGSANQSLRQALRDDLGKDSDLQLLTGADAKGQQYQAALFSFVKNASANPWANVLGGLDDWGQARQEELKDIIREVLHEEAAKEEPNA